MTAARSKSKTIDLKDLLAPRVQDIVTKGSGFKDPQYSLYHTAREAIGWQNWIRERQLPMTGSPLEVVRASARSLGLNSMDVDQAIAVFQWRCHSLPKRPSELIFGLLPGFSITNLTYL